MSRRRDLVLANLAGAAVLLLALLAGWREAAEFGLAVLAILNLTIILRERMSSPNDEEKEE
ncbi:MAG: hypothetical protein M8467_01850 [Anaerolineae bacterium]|nr:hypothetical protein [Anaerolineae bacterium]